VRSRAASRKPTLRDARGGHRFIVDPKTLDRLTTLRGPGESYSDVILRLVETER
jgi:hypothetical protein